MTLNNNIFYIIKEQIELHHVIECYAPFISLRKSGSIYKALCPFHKEKTPSFTVYKNRYKCFGCQEGGSAIDFVSKLYNIAPLEAARDIALKFGLNHYCENLTHEKAREIQDKYQKQILESEFIKWENDTFNRLVFIHKKLKAIFELQGIEVDFPLVKYIHKIPIIEYWLDILVSGTYSEKFYLYIFRDTERWFK